MKPELGGGWRYKLMGEELKEIGNKLTMWRSPGTENLYHEANGSSDFSQPLTCLG